ncbi:MAG TPA: thioredoxin domain-containing protein, partial [Candidatus Dojkabacteria bacterium]|nr:thioredoxin domain-containing protein [Candidatus Dojkabacteria bacterium]
SLDKLLIPFAILLAGLMISLTVFFSLRNNTPAKTTDTNTTTDTTGTTGTPTATGDGSANISLDNDPYLGDKSKAKIAIVEFSDFECPYCQLFFQQTAPDLIKNYINTGKAILVYRDYPLSFHEPNATNESMAANCVFDQGGNDKYFKYHDLIFQNSKVNGAGLATTATGEVDKLKEYAGKVGVDVNKFMSCYNSKKFADEITKDEADGTAAGITGTPGFIIGKFDKDGNIKNGVVLSGAYPYANFQVVLDKLLSE